MKYVACESTMLTQESRSRQKKIIGPSSKRFNFPLLLDILANIIHYEKGHLATHLIQIRLQPDRKKQTPHLLPSRSERRNSVSRGIALFERQTRTLTSIFGLPQINSQKIFSSNRTQRTGMKVTLCSQGRCLFLKVESWVRLVTHNLIEYTKDWEFGFIYFKKDKFQ